MTILKKIIKPEIKKIPNDDFIKRLRCSVIGEGMLPEGNIYPIDFAIKNMPENGAVIEIGSYGGLSTNLICYLLKKHNKSNPFFTCDAWIYEGYYDSEKDSSHPQHKSGYMDGRDDIKRADYMHYIKQSFINSTKFLSKDNMPHSFHLTSDDFFVKWENEETLKDLFGRDIKLGGKISFAYIDGDHSYKAARNDFENTAKNLLSGGFIFMDDTADYFTYGSKEYMQELKKKTDFEIVLSNPNYLLRKI